MGDPHDSPQAQQGFLIDFVSAHQVGVVAEIPQEPAEFPKSLRSAVEPTGEGTTLMFFWFENSEPQDEERPLRMPAVEGPIDADQENAFQDVFTRCGFHDADQGCGVSWCDLLWLGIAVEVAEKPVAIFSGSFGQIVDEGFDRSRLASRRVAVPQ